MSKTVAQRKTNAVEIIWGTFIPVPMPDDFFGLEDDARYDFIDENAYEIYQSISSRDLDKNMASMMFAVECI